MVSIGFQKGVRWLVLSVRTDQCSQQSLQAKGHKYYPMTTPIILNVVIVSTKHLLHVYHCQQSILVQFNVH